MIIRATRLAALALVCACTAAPAEEPAAAHAAERGERSAGRDTVVRAAHVEPLATLYDSATADVDGDGTAERVELGSSASPDQGAQDVHDQWSVIVRDGLDSYSLLHEYVPAAAAFWVIPADSAGPAAILVQTSAVYGPSEGTRLEKFVFDRSRGGYVRTGSIEGWAGHAIYRGPRGFEANVPPTGKGRHDPLDHGG